ncbi:HEAT repeat domain-containing protein [Paludisphaera sp.]|uniref:HEAT repeat domain-containing protein n=1 Tax=Paludisphaera sp. TaxID=2017432 RepID=UPI00301D1AE9
MNPRETPYELPEVEGPSTEFVLRLFVIPALIVAGIVGLWLAMSTWGGAPADVMASARKLGDGREGWRAAFELANRLRSDPATASDPRLLGELTRRLDAELTRGGDPRMAEYLALAVGSFQTDAATVDDGEAVDPLAALARGLDARHDPVVRVASAASLARHAARAEGAPPTPGVLEALAAAARAGDLPELRRVAVFSVGFHGGEPAAEILRERLGDDPDRCVRDNAALALARRGDPAAAAAIASMLAPDDGSGLARTVRLQALAALARPAASALLRDSRPRVEALAASTDAPTRDAALRLLQILQANAEL